MILHYSNMQLEELITVLERHYNSSDNFTDGSITGTKVPDLVYQITDFSKITFTLTLINLRDLKQ
jgi:hypothetical protein